MNKDQERFYVEQAASALEWLILEERESPDFVVREGRQGFGLELTEVFNGPIENRGARMKEGEAARHKTIGAYRRRYADLGGPPLSVKILGDPREAELDQLLEDLQRYDFESMPVGEHRRLNVGEQLKVFVTRALRPHWQSVDDTIGWVNRDASPILQGAIARKARRLDRYRQAVGSDVRLLVVANHLHASGMLCLEPGTTIDCCGFGRVYFFPYPQDVQILC